MASNRDRLRNMSKKNTQEAEKLNDVPTLISDVAEREDNTDSEVQIQSEKEVEKENTIENNVAQEEVTLEEDNQKEGKNDKTLILSSNDEPCESEENVSIAVAATDSINEKNSEDILHEKAQTILNNPEREARIQNLMEKYQGEETTISLLLQPKANNYLTYKAMDLRISSKQLLKKLLVRELEKGYNEDALCPTFRQTQRQTIKRSILIDKQLKADVMEAAITYRMKYTAFISYTVYKAYVSDNDYKELM